MKEEIGVKVKIKKLIEVMSDPKRDPREHIISIVYMADIVSGKLKAGDDAKAIKVVKFEDAKKMKLLCDHTKILQSLTI